MSTQSERRSAYLQELSRRERESGREPSPPSGSTTGSPVVAVGPYTAGRAGSFPHYGVVTAADGTTLARVTMGEGRDTDAQAALFAASWDLLAACEAALPALENFDHVFGEGADFLVILRAAIAKARGLRPCDDPALVPEVLQAQPQCVHGEREDRHAFLCPVHGCVLKTSRHEHPTNGGVWYTYVCDGYLEEQKESVG